MCLSCIYTVYSSRPHRRAISFYSKSFVITCHIYPNVSFPFLILLRVELTGLNQAPDNFQICVPLFTNLTSFTPAWNTTGGSRQRVASFASHINRSWHIDQASCSCCMSLLASIPWLSIVFLFCCLFCVAMGEWLVWSACEESKQLVVLARLRSCFLFLFHTPGCK
jgi:hypothetical protein